MGEPIALVALILDAAIGWPQSLYRAVGHPVGLFAALINSCAKRWNRPQTRRKRLAGIATLLLLICAAAIPSLLIAHLARALLGEWAWIAVALVAFPGLAQRSLHDHVVAVARALEADDIPAAREAVGMIVGRDTETLDQAGVSRAAIESLAESFCDGVVAPLFWLLLLGLPGLWIYKAINTADSMIGHKEQPWRAFGWACARTDDAVNFVPARLAGFILCVAGPGGWHMLRRDHAQHASPNAGWPEAAMAGALAIRLAGPIAYDGIEHAKPWIGEGPTDLNAAHIRKALGLYSRACLILWAVSAALAWSLS